MNTSESVSKIAPALLTAQRAIRFATKDAVNPHFKSKYADLPAVIDAIKPALNDAGIVFMQLPAPSDPGTLAISTRLMHESGEWIESTATAPLQKNDPQGYGSAITYLRRYSLAAAVGLYQDDDDGNAASQPARTAKPTKAIPALASAAEDSPVDDEAKPYLDELAAELVSVFNAKGKEEAYERMAIEGLDNEQKLYLSTRLPSAVRNGIKAISMERNKQKASA